MVGEPDGVVLALEDGLLDKLDGLEAGAEKPLRASLMSPSRAHSNFIWISNIGTERSEESTIN